MYTGIVQGTVRIVDVADKPNLRTFTVELPPELRDGLAIGASVSINGTCITATTIGADHFTFDAIAETLRLTNLGELTVGSRVNIERSAKAGAEVGGHILSGHVYATVPVIAIERAENSVEMRFQGEPGWMKYLFLKGFIALNGCSLTLSEVDREKSRFGVSLIPETLRCTTFGEIGEGARVNVEIDNQTQVIVDTVERVMEEKLASGSWR